MIKTNFYTEDAYTIVSLLMISRSSGVMCCSKKDGDYFRVQPLKHLSSYHGIGYVIRTATGEIVMERPIPLKRTLKTVIGIIGKRLGDDDEFYIMPAYSFDVGHRIDKLDFFGSLKKSIEINKSRISEECCYEKVDYDYAMSHPLTLRKLKEWYANFGKMAGTPNDPFQTEARHAIYVRFVELYEKFTGMMKAGMATFDNKSLLPILSRGYSYEHKFTKEDGREYSVSIWCSRALLMADEIPLEEDIYRFINEICEEDQKRIPRRWSTEEIEALKMDADKLFSSAEWAEWKDVLRTMKTMPKMMSPLLCPSSSARYWFKVLLSR